MQGGSAGAGRACASGPADSAGTAGTAATCSQQGVPLLLSREEGYKILQPYHDFCRVVRV